MAISFTNNKIPFFFSKESAKQIAGGGDIVEGRRGDVVEGRGGGRGHDSGRVQST